MVAVLPMVYFVLYMLWDFHYEGEFAKVGIVQGGDSTYVAARVAGQWMLVLLLLHFVALTILFRRRAHRRSGAI